MAGRVLVDHGPGDSGQTGQGTRRRGCALLWGTRTWRCRVKTVAGASPATCICEGQCRVNVGRMEGKEMERGVGSRGKRKLPGRRIHARKRGGSTVAAGIDVGVRPVGEGNGERGDDMRHRRSIPCRRMERATRHIFWWLRFGEGWSVQAEPW
jgi:hypothetical protein